MELLQNNNNKPIILQPQFEVIKTEEVPTALPFIEANTIDMSQSLMEKDHIIPVFSASNQRLISHNEFIDVVHKVVQNRYRSVEVKQPNIRVSHPIKGRVPEAKHKAVCDLEDWEQTLFYERMMFVVEVPDVSVEIEGSEVSLTIGGVKSYTEDNLYGKRPNGEQHFQLFIGFKNQVCSNLCVSTDGLKSKVNVNSIDELEVAILRLINSFDVKENYEDLYRLNSMYITESEFAQFIGRSRMYRYLSNDVKKLIPEMEFGDQQLGAVVRDYHIDENFCHDDTGGISLWRFYNLLTGVNKSSYIDRFLSRSVNALDLSKELLDHKLGVKQSWYLT